MAYQPQSTTTLFVKLGAVFSGKMTSGSAVLQAPPGTFSAADVGCPVTVIGCGAAIPVGGGTLPGGPPTNQVQLIGTVSGFTDGAHVTLSVSAACTFDGITSGTANVTLFRPVITDASGSTGCLSGSIQWDSTLTARDTAAFAILSIDGSFVPQRGQPVLITDTNDGDIFGGFIDQVKVDCIPGSPAITTSCQCISWDGLLTRRLVGTYQSTYGGMTALAVVTALVYYHADAEGFNVIQTGPTGPTIGFAQYDYSSSVSSALDDVVTKSYSATASYYWYVDPWKRIYFVAQNTTTAPFNCEDATGDGSYAAFLIAFSATYTGEKLANRVFVASSKQLVAAVTETFAGNGSTKSFSTSNSIGTTPTISDSRYGTQTVGVDGVDAPGTYQWYWSEGSSSVRQDASGTTPTASTTISVTYQGEQSALAYYQYTAGVNAQANVTGGTGFADLLLNLDNVSEAGPPSDGLVLATSVATEYGTIPIAVDLTTYKGGLRCAQLITVKLAKFFINANFLIDQVKLSTANNVKLWTIHAVFGPLVGDWRTGMIDLAGGPRILGAGGAPGTNTVAPAIWAPNYETPLSGDALFSAIGFGISLGYALAANGDALATLTVYGYPPADPLGLLVKVRRVLVSGIFAQQAASVTTNVIHFGGSGGTTNQFGGRIVSKLANSSGSSALVPIQDFTITANDTSGNFTVTPDPAAAGCTAGDLFTVRTAPTAADAISFTDTLFNNLYNAGLTGSGNIGNLVLVIGGTGAGQRVQTVTANTGTKVTVSPGWDVTPDATSVIVLIEAVPQVESSPDTTAMANGTVGSLPIDNYAGKVVRVEGYTSANGLTGPIETVPFRELYVWGAQGTRVITT